MYCNFSTARWLWIYGVHHKEFSSKVNRSTDEALPNIRHSFGSIIVSEQSPVNMCIKCKGKRCNTGKRKQWICHLWKFESISTSFLGSFCEECCKAQLVCVHQRIALYNSYLLLSFSKDKQCSRWCCGSPILIYGRTWQQGEVEIEAVAIFFLFCIWRQRAFYFWFNNLPPLSRCCYTLRGL